MAGFGGRSLGSKSGRKYHDHNVHKSVRTEHSHFGVYIVQLLLQSDVLYVGPVEFAFVTTQVELKPHEYVTVGGGGGGGLVHSAWHRCELLYNPVEPTRTHVAEVELQFHLDAESGAPPHTCGASISGTNLRAGVPVRRPSTQIVEAPRGGEYFRLPRVPPVSPKTAASNRQPHSEKEVRELHCLARTCISVCSISSANIIPTRTKRIFNAICESLPSRTQPDAKIRRVRGQIEEPYASLSQNELH